MVEKCGFCDIRTLGLLYGFFQQSVLLLETGCKGGAFLRNLSHPSVASEYHRNHRSNTQNDSGQGNQKPGVFLTNTAKVTSGCTWRVYFSTSSSMIRD